MTEESIFEPLANNDPQFSGYRFRIADTAEPPMQGMGLEGAQLEGLGDPGLNTGDAVILDQHYVRAVAYTVEAGGKISWFSSLFNAQVDVSKVGVIQEAKSFMVGTIDGKQVEIGVAVVLRIEASSFESKAQVSVANIAAEAQLGMSNAEMEISVRGFTGVLGDMLPAPSAVDLASYAHYLKSFEQIQKHVFGKDGKANFSPVVLGKLRTETEA